MNDENAISAMKIIIAEERRQGCPMALEIFIEPALRRWRSYDRRLKRHKDKSLNLGRTIWKRGCENGMFSTTATGIFRVAFGT